MTPTTGPSQGVPIAFLRHGRTAWNLAGRLQGATDIALDGAERRRLESLILPHPWTEADLVSSPLRRARETAVAVSGGRIPGIHAALTEMSWGDWEGARGEDLARDRPEAYLPLSQWGWDFRPPGGETPALLRDRLRPWLAGLRRPTLAVTHIGVMRVALALAHGWDFKGEPPFKVKRDRLYIITLSPDGRLVPTTEPLRLGTMEEVLNP